MKPVRSNSQFIIVVIKHFNFFLLTRCLLEHLYRTIEISLCFKIFHKMQTSDVAVPITKYSNLSTVS